MGSPHHVVSRPVTQIQDFVVVPIHIRPSITNQTSPIHHLYLRHDAPRIPTEDTPRELYVANVPIDATELHFRMLFAEGLGAEGRVESVVFEGHRAPNGIAALSNAKKSQKRKRHLAETVYEQLGARQVGKLPEVWDRELRTSGSSAVVRMVDKASADLVMREAKRCSRSGRKVVWDVGVHSRVPALGSARYLTHHSLRFPDMVQLQKSVDDFMEAFSAQESARAKILARQRSVPDEDGFITVTRGGRNGPAREEDTKLKEEELKRREKNMVKDDFYRFQTREKRKEITKGLVRAFEEDAKKVEEMRKKRNKFRPE